MRLRGEAAGRESGLNESPDRRIVKSMMDILRPFLECGHGGYALNRT